MSLSCGVENKCWWRFFYERVLLHHNLLCDLHVNMPII